MICTKSCKIDYLESSMKHIHLIDLPLLAKSAKVIEKASGLVNRLSKMSLIGSVNKEATDEGQDD